MIKQALIKSLTISFSFALGISLCVFIIDLNLILSIKFGFVIWFPFWLVIFFGEILTDSVKPKKIN